MPRALIIVLLTLVMVTFISFGTLYRFVYSPLSTKTASIVYEIPKGSSLKKMVRQMQQKEIMTPFQAFLFRYWIRFKGKAKQIKAGEYEIDFNSTPHQLLKKLTRGEVILHAITFSEGITFEEALALLQKHPAIDAHPFYDRKVLMFHLREPGIDPEGLFFPSTYFFKRGTTSDIVLKMARTTMQQQLEKAFSERSPLCLLQSPYEVLILASIIEKESALSSERPIISGVFQRRLAKNMLLQADPTLIYGLQEEYVGNLTSAQLKRDFAYNTYTRKGLPPTPIALPSLNAIIAACHPDESQALYFVAKGDGSHEFSNTLRDHELAVKKYRDIERRDRMIPRI